MGGLRADGEIPLLPSFFYLFSKAGSDPRVPFLALSAALSGAARSALKTVSGGEFDWGGTSVKE